MSYLTNYKEIDEGYVAFGGNPKGGKITRKDHLGKFDGKADEGFFVGYSLNSKAFKVFNSRTRIVEENLHIRFSESTPNVVGSRLDWLFDIDALTKTINYEPIVAGTQSNGFPDPKSFHDDGSKPSSDDGKKVDEDPRKKVNVKIKRRKIMLTALTMLILLEMLILTFYFSSDDEDDSAVADMNNLDTTIKEHGFVSTIQQRTNRKDLQNCLFAYFLSHEEPKKVIHALKDPRWIKVKQEELLQFKLLEVWTLVDLPNRKRAIGSKWVFRNKKGERRIMIRNKARLVAQGYTQEEGIGYDEVFVPVVRIKAIGLFLAYASFKDFMVYQMDVKSVFFYGKIVEEVHLCQPPRFEDLDIPDRVYKVEKAMYGLHQALRAWYETLSTYLLDNEFQIRKFDKALFIKRHKGDILLVQVYVDDIIFGELTFFLGLQVKQKKDGIFISQDKYVAEILNKFRFKEVKTASTPMETQKPLLKDEDGKEVDVHMYRSMIGLLMYLTSLRPVIMFVVCACARYQVNSKVSHLHVVKRIFRYLKGQPKLGLWYPKDSPFDLVAHTDSDYAGANLDRKSTIGVLLVILNITELLLLVILTTVRDLRLADKEGIDCLPNSTVFEQIALIRPKNIGWNEFSSAMACAIIFLATNQKFNFSKFIFDSMIRNLDSVSDKVVHKELDDILVRAATTASSLEAEQDSGNITKTQSKAIPNEPSSQGTDLGGGPRCQETMRDTITQTRVEYSGDEEILGEDASKQGRRIDAIDADEEITMVSVYDEVVSNDADKDLALKTSKPKVKGIVLQEPSASTTTTTKTISLKTSQDKGKAIMIEEPVNPKKKDQIKLDKEATLRLEAEFDEEARLARERAQKEQEANIALIEE
nr:putative ribonuclease H-like domain-containing protein [Tanacetum cinerariifolium]